jgi:hypothetical protein
MSPRQYLEEVVKTNMAELSADYPDFRNAYNAVHAVDALAAHIYHAAGGNCRTGADDDTAYREQLAIAEPEFGLVRDLAKALKHVALIRGKPSVTSAARIQTKSLGWGEARGGEGRWGSPLQVVVVTDKGDNRVIETVLINAVSFLKLEMKRLGL